jgi:RNA polymerase sigma-70 factor (ECF subfamily)
LGIEFGRLASFRVHYCGVLTDEWVMTFSCSSDDVRIATVVAAARRGDRGAVEWLFTELQPPLLRYLRAQDSRAAEDLAGEVWMAVATRLGEFEGDWMEFRGWVFSIARRRLADHRRTMVRRRTDVAAAEMFERCPASEETDRVVLDALSAQEAATLIVSVLNADQAEVLLLRLLADLDVDQVATIMGRSANWVRVAQHRGLRTLAARVGPKIVVMG